MASDPKLAVLEKIQALMDELEAQKVTGALSPEDVKLPPPGVDAAVAGGPPTEDEKAEDPVEEATETPAAEATEDAAEPGACKCGGKGGCEKCKAKGAASGGSDLDKLRSLAKG